jgi:hypothetical protein
MAAVNGDVLSSIQSMKSIMAGKAFTLASKMTSPSHHSRQGGSPAMIRNGSAPPEPSAEPECTSDDATVVIQLSPSPPVVDNHKGGVSRDWSLIFEVVRDEYKEKVRAMIFSSLLECHDGFGSIFLDVAGGSLLVHMHAKTSHSSNQSAGLALTCLLCF